MIELQHDYEQMAALLDLMLAVNATADPHALAKQAIDHLIARELIAAGVWLARSGDLVCLARRNLDPDALLPEIQGMLDYPATAPRTSVYQRELRLTLLPLMRADESIGALAVVTHLPPDPRALLLLRAVAAHLGGALAQARLDEQPRTSDRAWEEFLSHAAHEIKNPLASIKGYADLLLRRAAKDPADPYYRGLTTISQQVSRTTALLEQLSDMTRIAADRLPIEPRAGDFVALVDRVVHEYQTADQQHTVAVERRDSALPCRFDDLRMGQAVGAVIGNAIKFSPDGGTISVVLQRSAAGDGTPVALLSIGDTGVGVPEGEQERVFERFFRGSNIRGTYSGMGIGLYIARAILDRHGGRIWLQRARERGTNCFMTLPLI